MSFAALLLLAQVATATPAQAVQAPAPATPVAAAQKSKTICVVEDQTGSRLSANRVCRSKTEWDAVKAEITENLNLRQRNTQK
jgi:hypothetical protein